MYKDLFESLMWISFISFVLLGVYNLIENRQERSQAFAINCIQSGGTYVQSNCIKVTVSDESSGKTYTTKRSVLK